MMTIIKIILLFIAIVSMFIYVERIILINMVVKHGGRINGSTEDEGTTRLVLMVGFSLSVALLIVLW